MKTNIKIGELLNATRQALPRFPETFILIGLLTILVSCNIWIDDYSNYLRSEHSEYLTSHSTELLIVTNNDDYVAHLEGLESTRTTINHLLYFSTCGIWISFLFRLWMEEHKKRRNIAIAYGVSILLLAIDTTRLYLMSHEYFQENIYEIVLSRIAIYVSCGIGAIILPFYDKKDDIESSNFFLNTFKISLQSGLVAFVAFMGWSGLYSGTKALFDIGNVSITTNFWLNNIPLVLLCITAPLILLASRIPNGEAKHNATFEASKFYSGILHYLIIPLVACYMIVLYVYLITIIAQWSLPKGGVVSMVSAMMTGLGLIIMMLYPIVKTGGNKFDKATMKYSPMLALPLVILMIVAICRRFADYGISVNRIYVATFCVLSLISCIGLILNKGKRIRFIPLTFGFLLLITSAHPFNVVNITSKVMHNKLKMAIESTPPESMPLNSHNTQEWLYSLPDSSGTEMLSYISNLQTYKGEHFDTILVSPAFYISEWSYNKYKSQRDTMDADAMIEFNFAPNLADTLFYQSNKGEREYDVPQGFKHLKFKSLYLTTKKDSLINGNEIILHIGKEKLHLNAAQLLSLGKVDTNKTYIRKLDGATETGKKVVVMLRNEDIILLEYNGWCRFRGSMIIFFNDGVDLNSD